MKKKNIVWFLIVGVLVMIPVHSEAGVKGKLVKSLIKKSAKKRSKTTMLSPKDIKNLTSIKRMKKARDLKSQKKIDSLMQNWSK